jgi:diacylglycerol O-acyltransferase / wax synthase
MDATPLSDEDRAILALESPTVAGHTCKVIEVGAGGPKVEELRERIAGRIDAAPALLAKLGGDARHPMWVRDEEFDLSAHVRPAVVDEPVDRDGLRRLVAELFAERLDRRRPLWRIDVAETEDGGSVLVWRIHHALADGTACMRYARVLLFDEEQSGAAAASAAHAEDEQRRRAHLASFIHREFTRSHGHSPFDGRIGTQRVIAFAATPLRALHDAARALGGATVNDGVLATVGGGLRRWLQTHHGSLGDVRVKVPVSLHREGDDVGNRDSFFTLAVPLDTEDAAERLRIIHAQTVLRKADHDAEEMDVLLRSLGRLAPQLEHFCDRISGNPRRFALNVSNVPGPHEPVFLGGARVEAVHSIAEIGERHGLRVSVISCGGVLYYGLCADPGIVDDLDAMAAGIEQEAAQLVAASGAGDAPIG